MFAALAYLCAASVASVDGGATVTAAIFDRAVVEFDPGVDEIRAQDGSVRRRSGQIVEAVCVLPPAPADDRGAARIVLTVTVLPRLIEIDGGFRPGDPWTRLGSVSVVDGEDEIELMRFMTGFGGAGAFTQDITPFAPLLHGRRTLRAFISTWAAPGWELSASIEYTDGAAGFRRPAIAQHLFSSERVTSEENTIRGAMVLDSSVSSPRIRIISTGHATDGKGGDEFITRTHVLRVNGREIARWRPWAEGDTALRPGNPMSGRRTIGGRSLWSSDLDRSGWNPGRAAEPLVIPLPGLSPGRHEVELEIEDIRPRDPEDAEGQYGYWRVSAALLADEPWPERGGRPSRD
jgi:hypothetical protein